MSWRGYSQPAAVSCVSANSRRSAAGRPCPPRLRFRWCMGRSHPTGGPDVRSITMSLPDVSAVQEAAMGALASAVRKPNVLVLSTSLWNGGAESVIRHLAETLDRDRFNVLIGHLKERGHVGDQIAAAGHDVIGVSDASSGRVNYLTFLDLLRLIRAKDIHLVHTHTTG